MAELTLFAHNLVIAVCFVSLLFCIAWLRNRRYDLIDVGWGCMFVLIAAYDYFRSGTTGLVDALLLAMICVWGIRLAWHIYKRWSQSDKEDGRYVELRAAWPTSWVPLQVYVRIYLLQAVLACVVSLPVMLLMRSQPHLSGLVAVGFVVWVCGFIFEVIADRQLAYFIGRPENKGMLMTAGLWKYSRHPNYFGELVMWWGIAVMALSAPYGWAGLGGAFMITVLILFVSGIPPAERRASTKKGWQQYKASTSVLLPFPKIGKTQRM